MYCVLYILSCILWASGPEINVILSYLCYLILGLPTVHVVEELVPIYTGYTVIWVRWGRDG